MRQCNALLAVMLAGAASAQIVGTSVNMVTGTSWPNGDPFLQRQNEPSMAVSSRNPLHMLAGANDYRSVDLPGLTDNCVAADTGQQQPCHESRGDAWLGVFKSYDGGDTWRSTLLPGYPQQQDAKSPLFGMQAAADPVVRPGTNGLFYFGGVAFRRGKDVSKLFLARFIDDNNAEGGDTIRYLDTQVIRAGDPDHFQDKPAFAADIPRDNTHTCAIPPSKPFAAGRVYAAWTEFKGGENSKDSQILFSHSEDCGVTWATPVSISGQEPTSHGAAIAINQVTGAVYVAFRVIAKPFGLAENNKIVIVASNDGGLTFSGPLPILITPFDQETGPTSFRTRAYPALAVDARGSVGTTPALYVAWSQRGEGPSADARIRMSVIPLVPIGSFECLFGGAPSTCGLNIAGNPVVDNPSDRRGYQFMPALAVASGKLNIAWYDNRDAGLIPYYTPKGGGQYSAATIRDGSPVFDGGVKDPQRPYLAGARRQTLDVWVAQSVEQPRLTAQANGQAAKVFGPSAKVSSYAFGTIPDKQGIRQLEFSAPNLPIFETGQAPFIGDYIDIAGPTFIANGDGTWRFNSDPADPDHTHVAWTDNRNVVPPPDGDWKNYTPLVRLGAQSNFDSTQPSLGCIAGHTSMRNQDVYTARISQGLVGSAKANSTPVTPPNQPLQRVFPVTVRNTSDEKRTYNLAVVKLPPGAQASFLQFSSTDAAVATSVDIEVPARSSAAKSLLVSAADPGTPVQVRISQTYPKLTPVPQTVLSLNVDGTNPDPSNPGTISKETYNPTVSTPEISNPEISNPEISNPEISNPEISNPEISNPEISNPEISNQRLANFRVANPEISNPEISNPEISNPEISNPEISNPEISNPEISNAALTDVTWAIANTGNSTSVYSLKMLGILPPPNVTLQMIVSKRTNTPVADNCTLKIQPHYVSQVNKPSPPVTPVINPNDPSYQPSFRPDTSGNTPTVAIAPGEKILLTIRALNQRPVINPLTNRSRGRLNARTLVLVAQLDYNPATALTPLPVPDLPNTGAAQPSLPLTVVTSTLIDGVAGKPYSQSLSIVGGVPFGPINSGIYQCALAGGSVLPPGLNLRPDCLLSSTQLTGSANVAFSVRVNDAANAVVTKELTLRVQPASGGLTITSPNLVAIALVGSTLSQQLTANGGTGALSWTLISGPLPQGLVLTSAGMVKGVPVDAAGVYKFTVRVTDSAGANDSRTLAVIVDVPTPPVIAAVRNGASGEPVISGGSWVSIYGVNFGGLTRTWSNADFNGNALPRTLGNLSSTIDGAPALVEYVSPTQINILSPVLKKEGPVVVTVTDNTRPNGGNMGSFTVDAQTYAPGFFVLSPTAHVAARHADGSLVAPADLFGAGQSREAQAGEVVEIYGTGFGPTIPAVDPAVKVPGPALLADLSLLHVTIGGSPANVKFAGVTSSGLYQLNVEVPISLPDGIHEVLAEVGGVKTQSGATIAVKK